MEKSDIKKTEEMTDAEKEATGVDPEILNDIEEAPESEKLSTDSFDPEGENTYIGVKMIRAKKMTRGEFAELKGDKIKTGNADDEGYLVICSDDYQSWSPKKVFDDAYFRINSDERVSEGDLDRMVGNFNVYDLDDEKTTMIRIKSINGFVDFGTLGSYVSEYDRSENAARAVQLVKQKAAERMQFIFDWAKNGLTGNIRQKRFYNDAVREKDQIRCAVKQWDGTEDCFKQFMDALLMDEPNGCKKDADNAFVTKSEQTVFLNADGNITIEVAGNEVGKRNGTVTTNTGRYMTYDGGKFKLVSEKVFKRDYRLL